MPVQVGDLSWGWGLGTTVTPYRRRDDTSFKYSKTSTDGNNEDTYRSKLGVLSFISVVVQSDEVKTRLHLVAASAKHVLTTLTLTRFWRATGKIHNVRKFRWSFLKIWRKIALEDKFNAVTNSQDSKTGEKWHPSVCWTAVKACLCNSCKYSFLIGWYRLRNIIFTVFSGFLPVVSQHTDSTY